MVFGTVVGEVGKGVRVGARRKVLAVGRSRGGWDAYPSSASPRAYLFLR